MIQNWLLAISSFSIEHILLIFVSFTIVQTFFTVTSLSELFLSVASQSIIVSLRLLDFTVKFK